MTHLLFVTGEYPPMEGGVGAYTAELGKALRSSGVQVSVVTSKLAAPKHIMSDVAATGATGDAKAVFPIIQKWGPNAWGQIARLAQNIHADWIHVQYQTAAYAMNPAINFAPERWRRGFRVAWTYHDLLPPYLFPKAGARLRRWVTERPASTSQLVIVTNEGDRLQLAAKGIDAANIPIGSNIRGESYTFEERQARRALRNFAADDLVIGYFGFLNRSKGVATVLRTVQRLKQQRSQVQLLMIGDVAGASDPTNQAYYAEIRQMIIDLGLIDHVHWTGREDDAAVSADLAACDLLLLPYLDGASLRRGTLMAALANGCPIITTTPQAPLPELVDGRDLLFIPADDDAQAAEFALRIAKDQHLAQKLRTNARERSALFTWESIAQQHLAWYAR